MYVRDDGIESWSVDHVIKGRKAGKTVRYRDGVILEPLLLRASASPIS